MKSLPWRGDPPVHDNLKVHVCLFLTILTSFLFGFLFGRWVGLNNEQGVQCKSRIFLQQTYCTLFKVETGCYEDIISVYLYFITVCFFNLAEWVQSLIKFWFNAQSLKCALCAADMASFYICLLQLLRSCFCFCWWSICPLFKKVYSHGHLTIYRPQKKTCFFGASKVL